MFSVSASLTLSVSTATFLSTESTALAAPTPRIYDSLHEKHAISAHVADRLEAARGSDYRESHSLCRKKIRQQLENTPEVMGGV